MRLPRAPAGQSTSFVLDTVSYLVLRVWPWAGQCRNGSTPSRPPFGVGSTKVPIGIFGPDPPESIGCFPENRLRSRRYGSPPGLRADGQAAEAVRDQRVGASAVGCMMDLTT